MIEFNQFCYGVTTNCNAKCEYCYASKNKKTLNFETFKKAVNFLSAQTNDLSVFIIGGGENTLELPLLKRTIDYINDNFKKRWIAISTNGLFNKEALKIMQTEFDSIQFSYTPYSNKIFNKNLRLLKDHKDISVKIVCNESFMKKEQTAISELSKTGVKNIVYSKPTCVKTDITNKKYIESLRRVMEYSDRYGVTLSNLTDKKNNRQNSCGLEHVFNLTIEGSISCCQRHTCNEDLIKCPDLKYFQIGEIKDNVRIYEDKRENIIKQLQKNKKCEDCRLNKKCRSLCYLVNKMKNNCIEDPDKETCDLMNCLVEFR